MIAAVDGPAGTAAIRTPTARSAPPQLDNEEVQILPNDALDAALGDGEGNVHASHGGEVVQAIIGPRQSGAVHAK